MVLVTPEELASFSWYRGNLTWLRERTIFLTKHGSHAYGTNLPTSDLDLKGIAIAPREFYLGFLNHFEQAETHDPIDAVVYDVRKFFKLAADCNPNIIEMLFTDEADWILPAAGRDRLWGQGQNAGVWIAYFWQLIHEQRHLFLSQKARHTFSGYAVAQLKRLQSHRGWLLNPPKKQPERSDFGLKNGEPTIGKEQLGVVNAVITKKADELAGGGLTKDRVEEMEQTLVDMAVEHLSLDVNLVHIILAERRYAAACRYFQSYQKWKTERNPARAETEARFGYDTKHAMHLVRLLRMAGEILYFGKVVVKRPDAGELLAIRAGAWPYERLVEYAGEMDKVLGDAAAKSPLPREPDRVALDQLLVSVVSQAL